MRNMCGTIFYIKTNVLQDFHISMSVPLIPLVQRRLYGRKFESQSFCCK